MQFRTAWGDFLFKEQQSQIFFFTLQRTDERAPVYTHTNLHILAHIDVQEPKWSTDPSAS